jgi:putative membrane protein
VNGRLPTQEGWRRLHPLSPVARIGRLVPILVFGFVLSFNRGSTQRGRSGEIYYVLAIAVLSVVLGIVHWMVTRWKLDGETLRIETGLIRRDARQLPLARIQSVDIVRPLMARFLGISELRIRLAGSGSADGRLAYLHEREAIELRGRLLAGLHHVDPAVTEDVEQPMASVRTGRLVASVLLSGTSIILVAVVAALVITAIVSPKVAAAALGFTAVYILGLATAVWRLLSNEYHFEAVEAPEGMRIRRGLLETVTETIPYGRIQAIRQREPLLWRPFGWCRLEVDTAGATARNQRGEGSSVTRKALLPVGDRRDSRHLVDRLMGPRDPAMTPPPRRAHLKAPLSYHFLSAGHDESHAVTVTGRIRKETTWVPLEKSQSIRLVQGPMQRHFGLASVHIDVAGRRVRAEFRDRSVEEANALVETLSDLSRLARLHPVQAPATSRAAAAIATDNVPDGWYADPSGRHAFRYWNSGRWTEHVSDGGIAGVDPP